MAPAALVLDLDGTVWDSYPWYATILQHLGVMSADDCIAELMAGGNIMQLLRDARVPIATFLKAGTGNHLALYEGVPEVLGKLTERRVLVAILSGLSASVAEPMLAQVGLGTLFPIRVFAARKTSPLPYLRIAQSLNVPINAAAYVADMANDAVGAARAGMPFWWAA